MNQKEATRLKRKKRIRRRITGTEERPRLSIFRSSKHIYAQVVIDGDGRTLCAASTLSEKPGTVAKIDAAKHVGAAIARACQEKGIDKVVFDRNGFLYHGRVKALAEGAREAGLNF